jgi:hypothetical protein
MNRNSMAISIGAMILGLVLDLWIAPTAYAYDNTSLSGTITCTTGVLAGSIATASGTINVVADGKGHLTSGNASYRRGPSTSAISCNYALSSGTYAVQSNGSGQATTNWSLISRSSSPNCAATVSQSAISFSVAKAAFSAPITDNRSESGNCTAAAASAQ